MIKIKCLSDEKLAAIKKKWRNERTPIICTRLSDGYTTCYDVQLSDAVLLMATRFETSIFYNGSLLKLSDLDFYSIEIF